MGRYSEKYWDNQNSPLEDAMGTMFTAGLINVVPDPELAFKCEITDSKTRLTGVTNEWMPNKSMAHDAAWNDLEEKKHEYYESIRDQQERELRESYPKSNKEETDSSGWLVKWLIYIALFIGAVWLAFAVALPLIIINCATISFIIGLTFGSENKRYMFLLSLLGGIYVVIDYNKGFLTKTLVQNVSFFEKAIPFFLYLNITAGLIASYFLIRDFIDERKPSSSGEGEFSKRNLIIMGSLIAVGATTVLLQRHFDSQTSLETTYNINNSGTAVVGGDAHVPVVAGKMDSTKIDSSKMDSAKMDSAKTDNSASTTYYGLYPQASIRLLASNDVSALSKQNLRIMRNEIFARHGYIFKTADMKNYFAQQNWYRPLYIDVTNQLTSIEKTNVELIKSYEK